MDEKKREFSYSKAACAKVELELADRNVFWGGGRGRRGRWRSWE